MDLGTITDAELSARFDELIGQVANSQGQARLEAHAELMLVIEMQGQRTQAWISRRAAEQSHPERRSATQATDSSVPAQ